MELYNCDCLEKMKTMEKDSIDMLFCDLPYAQTNAFWDIAIDIVEFWKQVNRICKPEAAMIFTCTTKFGVSLINSNPKNFRYDMVWIKSAPCGHLNARRLPMRKHEMVYVFYNKCPKIYSENIALHHTKTLRKTTNKARGGECYGTRDPKVSEMSSYDPPLPNSVMKEDGCYKRPTMETSNAYTPPLPNSILEVKSEKGKHATQKPTELMKWFLKYYTKEGDVVLDPTAGSGSTGVACAEMNRKFIGMEMDPVIYQSAVERLNL